MMFMTPCYRVAAVAAKSKGWTASFLALTKVPSLRPLIRHCDRERSEDGKQSTDLSLRGTKQSSVAAVAAKSKGWTASFLALTKVPSLRPLIRHCDRERSEDEKQSTYLSLRLLRSSQ
jgi:sulfur relay (sulfurtransferase) DsrC/TusE family protein